MSSSQIQFGLGLTKLGLEFGKGKVQEIPGVLQVWGKPQLCGIQLRQQSSPGLWELRICFLGKTIIPSLGLDLDEHPQCLCDLQAKKCSGLGVCPSSLAGTIHWVFRGKNSLILLE